MGEQSAARLEGDRFQHLYSLYELLLLLEDTPLFSCGVLEHPEAGAADDLTFEPAEGSGVSPRFVQVKWHVTLGGNYTASSLMDAEPGKRSLLKKLYASWCQLRVNGDAIEIRLVSNYPAAPDFGVHVDARTYALLPSFVDCGARAAAGKQRKAWCEHLGASDADVQEFCRALRLQLGFSGIDALETQLHDRLRAHRLRSGAGVIAALRDQISALIEVGGQAKRVTAEILRELLKQYGVSEVALHERAGLWIHGWMRRVYDGDPVEELDWTPYFDRTERRIPTQEQWDTILLPQLRNAASGLLKQARTGAISFRGKLPLTALLAVGATLPEVAGFRFEVEQPTRGALHLWRSDEGPSPATLQTETVEMAEEGDVVIVLSVTGDARPEVEAYLSAGELPVKAVVYAAPTAGPGDASIASAADAVALAVAAKNLIRGARMTHRARRIHLIPFAPASLCLFLGQRLNALGEILTYERTAAGSYAPSVTLATG